MKIDMLYDTPLKGKVGAYASVIHTTELFKNFKKIGNEVILFVPKSKGFTRYKQPDIVYLPMLYVPLLRSGSYQLILFLHYLLHRIQHTKSNIIYSRMSLLTISPLILSKLFKIAYIVEINGLALDEMKLEKVSKLIFQIFKANERLNYKHANKIIAVTQGVKDGIIKLYNIPDEKIVVIENGANTDLFKPMDQNEAKTELNLNQDVNYVCFVGNLAPWQGVEYLIQSAPLILRECPHTKFVIVGEGQMKDELADKTGVPDKFIFTDGVPNEEVPKYINASDVCVVPKKPMKSGYSPLKLYEYMASGKPVIATRTDGFEILEESNSGILINPENSREFANAVIKLLQNEDLRKQMGENGRKCVVENHSWASVAKKIVDVCESTIVEQNIK